MVDHYTIAEVSLKTGLASHTIRYYEKQFPTLLTSERSKGGHRIYRDRHLEALRSILKLLKDENLSIRDARRILGESEKSEVEKNEESNTVSSSSEVAEISRSLALVVERLDRLCQSNERRDTLLEALIRKSSNEENEELMEQILRCRNETQETMKMYHSLMVQWKNSN